MRPVEADKTIFLQFQKEVVAVIPENKRWSMKTGVEYFPAYESLNPYNIFIKRKPEDVANSLCKKRPECDYDAALEATLWRFNYMDKIQAKRGGVIVDTDKIFSGDYSEIIEALKYCDIDYDEKLIKDSIKRGD